jgi:acetoin utilization deacetylase AcuC-like enzyme
MKILSDSRTAVRFPDFGIAIPVSPSKQERILSALREDPDLSASESRWHIPQVTGMVDRTDLLRVHSGRYVESLFSDGLEAELMRTLELIGPDGRYNRYDPSARTRPWTALLDRYLLVASGTYQSCCVALKEEMCYFLSGGMHHAQHDYGEGFCPINDIVIAARKLQAEDLAGNIWVIDMDAHKGDGTAALTQGDPSIVTLSIHMARGWPLDAPFDPANPSFIPSDIDIPVGEDESAEYCEKLEEGLVRLKEKYPAPDLVIVVDGSDPWEHDELPSTRPLRMTAEQMARRNALVHGFLKGKYPSAWLASGGYGGRSWEIHSRFLSSVLKPLVSI